MATDDRHRQEGWDRELDLKGIAITSGGTLAVTVLAIFAMWVMAVSFTRRAEVAEPVMTPVEAQQRERLRSEVQNREPATGRLDWGADSALPGLKLPEDVQLPPHPRLQISPEGELAELRAEARRDLDAPGAPGHGESAGRTAIERAMQRVLERGLPEAIPAEESPSPGSAPASEFPVAEPVAESGTGH